MTFAIKSKNTVIFISVILILVTLLTKYYGSTDIGDYADTAKYFAGKYSAGLRNSHSYLYGFILSPFLKISNSFLIFKIASLLFLFLIIYSVYRITDKSKKSLWLILLSPIMWYMAPWINSIQIASLFLLWAFYFIEKYDNELKLKYLAYSGILLGLGWAFWDTISIFGFFLALVFLFNKKLSHSFFFILFVLIGLIPRMALDTSLFGFPFYSILKSTLGTLANISGGIYARSSGWTPLSLVNLISVLLAIPLYFWILYLPLFKENKKAMIFLSLSLLIIVANPQARYVLSLVPIMIILLFRYLNEKQFRIQIAFSILAIILFTFPYFLQVFGSLDNQDNTDFTSILQNEFSFSSKFPSEVILSDLNSIIQEYSNQVFLVGNRPDDYAYLASIYWGKNVSEFVSIQDYELWENNQTILFEKRFMPIPRINDRRQIWFAGGIRKNENDSTDYSSIQYAIGINEPIKINSSIVKKYNILYLSRIK